MSTQGAPGVWMSVAGSTVELLVPRLFAAVPIVLPTDGIAVSDPDEVEHEELPPGAQPIDIVVLYKGRREANLLVVVAQRTLFPPVRYRARFLAEGFLFRRARARPHDAYVWHCFDRDGVIAELARHGVERTTAPYAWVTARRSVSR